MLWQIFKFLDKDFAVFKKRNSFTEDIVSTLTCMQKVYGSNKLVHKNKFRPNAKNS